MSHTPQELRPPLYVGVTGHRNINPADRRLRQLVLGQLVWVRSAYPHGPMVILSSLAEGADRLIARLAMERLGAPLVAPLPLPPHEYIRDFGSEGSRAEFQQLLAEAAEWFELPLEAPLEQAGPRSETRRRQYARAGAYVVERSAVLFALWDRRPARGTGGTAHLVTWMRTGRVPEEFSSRSCRRPIAPRDDGGLLILIDPRTYEVAHIRTPDQVP